MKQKSEKTIHDFLANAGSISDDIMEYTEKMFGSVPYIFPVMRSTQRIFCYLRRGTIAPAGLNSFLPSLNLSQLLQRQDLVLTTVLKSTSVRRNT